jgi:hypothetical protein
VDQTEPSVIRDELIAHIQAAIDDHPRSQQAELGPSETGKECSRWIAYRLLGTPELNPRPGSWRPTVGTAVHDWLADVFRKVPGSLVEQRVAIGQLKGRGGYLLEGNSDLNYKRIVVDWKIVGATTLKNAARGVVSNQYEKQAHQYGKGFDDEGIPVDYVAIFFLPAAGELRDGVFWCVPYDRSIAEGVLDRLNAIKSLVDSAGDLALTVLPSADDYCQKCEFFKPHSQDLAGGCPGHNPAPPKSITEEFMG